MWDEFETRDHNGCTALMFAVANGNEAITRRLILAQANVNNFDYENHSCLNYALQFNQTKLVGLLKKAGAMDKLSLDDEDEEEDDGAASMSPSASPSRLQLPCGLPDCETASCAESLSTEAPETSPLSAATGGADSPEVKKKKKKVKEEGEASPDAVKKKKKAATADGEKAEKGTKKKKVKSQGLGEKGLMEAVAVQDEGAITVKEEPEKKEEVPVEDGPTDEELAKAAAMKKEKEAAREALKEAVAKPEMSRLEQAIEKAQKAELEAKELAAAEKALSVERLKQDARGKLRDAEDSGNVEKLKAAKGEAMTAGLDASELKHVKAALRAAVQERNVHDLKFAIPQAKESGIDAKLISEAEEVLRLEEPKMKAREQLQEASTHVSKAALQAAIQAAKDAGLEASEFAKAEALLKKEEQKEKLMKEVNAALADSQQVDMKSIDALREMKDKLQTALKAALEAGVPEADLVPIDQRRKKLHNAVEDLKGSIRVFCRVRPLSKKETGQGDTSICEAVDQMTVKVKDEQFLFDAVFTPGTQDEVFEDCRDLVQSAADGYNVTMFAYGQTGAGKTFTMYGTKGNEGTAPRTIQEIFKVTQQGSDRFEYTVVGSMLELYCNAVVDLLSKGTPVNPKPN